MNPTIYKLDPTDAAQAMRIVDSNKDPQATLDLINLMEKKEVPLYGSFYRPGSVWNTEVFVCPKCAYATSEEFAEDMGKYYCKYCHTTWVDGPGVIEVKEELELET